MMSVKLATLDLLKIKILWNKGYDITISVYDITSKYLSYDSNYIVNMVLWPKIGNSNILEANSYVCRSYHISTGRTDFLLSLILIWVTDTIIREILF